MLGGAGLCFDGGDTPLATFLIRAALFASAARFLLASRLETIRPTLPDLLVLGFLLLEAASLARPGYAWATYQWFLQHAAVVIFYLLLRAETTSASRWPSLAGVGIVAIGLLQVAVASVQFVAHDGSRPGGTLVNPNLLAEFLVCSAIALLVLLPAIRERCDGRGRYAVLVLPVLLAGIAMTRSRGAILVLAAVLALIAAGRFGWRRTAAALAVAAALLVLVPNPVADRFAGKSDPYAFDRVLIWKSAARMAAAHPLGVGVGQFRYHWTNFRLPSEAAVGRYAKVAWHPHSEFLSAIDELGIPGGLIFAALAVAAVISLARAQRGADPASLGAATILFASGLHSLLEFNYHVLGLMLVNAAALALVSGRLWRPLFEVRLRPGVAVRAAGLLLIALLFAYSAATYAGAALEARGNRARAAGRGNEAVGAYRAAETADPLRSSAPDLAAALHLSRYEATRDRMALADAIDAEIEAIRRNPREYRYPERLGLLYAKAAEVETGDRFKASLYRAGLGSYDRAIALNPHNAALRYRKAMLLSASGADAEAAKAVEGLLAEEPRYAKGYALLGMLRDRQGRPGEAKAARQRALALRDRYAPLAREAYEREFFEFESDEVLDRMNAGPIR